MGNHASIGERRDRHKSGDQFTPYSPGRIDGQAFTFDKHKANKLHQQPSEEEQEPVVLKKVQRLRRILLEVHASVFCQCLYGDFDKYVYIYMKCVGSIQ